MAELYGGPCGIFGIFEEMFEVQKEPQNFVEKLQKYTWSRKICKIYRNNFPCKKFYKKLQYDTVQEWGPDLVQLQPIFKVPQKWLKSMKYVKYNS